MPDFTALRGPGFDPARVHPLVRDFYEHTADCAMDVWSESYLPLRLGLGLLVTTISRQVNQLNFPLTPLKTALGMTSLSITRRIIEAHGGTVSVTGESGQGSAFTVILPLEPPEGGDRPPR